MADYVERYSGKASDELEKKIRQVYKQAAEEVQKKLDDFIRGHKARNAQMLQMVSDGKMSNQDYQRWMRGQVFQGDQWKQKLKDVTDVYVHADEKAREIVGGTSKNVFMEAANYTAYDLEKGMRGAVAFNVYDAKTVERLLKKDPKMLPEWKIDQPKDYKWNEKRVRNAVAQGIIQGESVEEVGDRLTGELATSNATKMDMFARTAINGAQNAGRMDRLHEAEEMGIEVRKKWLATLDQRTRDTHQALDGQEQPIDEPFVVDGMKIDYPGDPFAPPELVYNCRCTLTYVYPKYQHLQHNHERRDQLNDKNIENMTYYEWLGLASKKDLEQEEPELEDLKKEEIPRIAGVERGNPMTHEQADNGKVNPHYSSLLRPYRTNCQSCVPTYFARLRGYNVEVVPNDAKHKMCEKLSIDTRKIWKTKDGKKPRFSIGSGEWKSKASWKGEVPSAEGFKQKVLKLQKDGQYTLQFSWRGMNSGHIVTMHFEKGQPVIYDPQSNKTISGVAFDEYIHRFEYNKKYKGTEFLQWPSVLRVDDLEFDFKVASKVMQEVKK